MRAAYDQPVDIDWGDGDDGRTAAALAPAAEELVDVAGIRAGDRVLDVGCGTGNAALAAAARGAVVSAVDPSPGLVALARGSARTPPAPAWRCRWRPPARCRSRTARSTP